MLQNIRYHITDKNITSTTTGLDVAVLTA